MRVRTKSSTRCGAALLALCLVVTGCTSRPGQDAAAPKAATPEQQAIDKLLAPIALYPDALLAQILACSTSPQQVKDFDQWLQKNQALQGSQRQEAASQAGFDASFVALALFPDMVNLMAQHLDWTTEMGKVFLGDQKSMLESVQRLRAQAQAAGNLKTTPQQEVKTDSQGGQQVIVIQPANPQVVYVPQYNPQTVYTTPAPASTTTQTTSTSQTTSGQSSDSGGKAAAALIGFALGVVVGAAANDDYYGPYGYGAWGMGWHTHTVVVHHGAWVAPPYGRYPYTHPTPHYRPNVNVYAPTNVNVNVNRSYNQVNRTTYNQGTRPTNYPSTGSRYTRPPATTGARPTTYGSGTARQQPSTPAAANYGSRGHGQSPSTYGSSGGARPTTHDRSGTSSSAFSGYQSGQSERAASSRGRSSSSRSSSGSSSSGSGRSRTSRR